MFQPLDGPSLQDNIGVTSGTAVELKVGATALSERQVITIQPQNGDIWLYFGDGTNVPSAATVSTKGFKHVKMAMQSYEAGDRQKLYAVANSGTVNVVFAERA